MYYASIQTEHKDKEIHIKYRNNKWVTNSKVAPMCQQKSKSNTVQSILAIHMNFVSYLQSFSVRHLSDFNRGHSLTMGAGGLKNPWGITTFYYQFLGGIIKFQVSQNKGDKGP